MGVLERTKLFLQTYNGKIIGMKNGNFGVVSYVVESKGSKYYIFSNARFFYKAPEIFKMPEYQDWISISKNILIDAVNDQATIVVYLGSSLVLHGSAVDWLAFCNKNNTYYQNKRFGTLEACVPSEILTQL